ncbi:jg23646, partial [Pararge aegeria aegeria]
VRRKVMHMRDQQLYYHRLRMWLEDQLRQERESLPESNVTLIEDLPRRKRRTASPKNAKISTAPKRKLKPANISQTISKPYKILQMLRHKAPIPNNINIKSPYKEIDDERSAVSEVEPPEAFPLEKEDNVSDTETIVGEKETGDICKEMRECLAKFANFALNSPDNVKEEVIEYVEPVKYPESVSPPLQEMSPTTSEHIPVFNQNPRRILTVNKIFNKEDKVIDFQSQAGDISTPLNNIDFSETKDSKDLDDDEKDGDVYKYVTFGLKIKKAMEECQNIINSYNSVSKDEKQKEDIDEPPSLEQIIEVMMNLDKSSAELLEKMDSDDPIDMNIAINKLSDLVENMPQTLANMPEIASKLSEFANASFELPEFASIMNSLPDVNNEAQLTPETLKQIRELKLSKRDSVKVTKNTAKRKINRRIKNNDSVDLANFDFEFDGKDLSELLRDEKELQNLMKNKNNKEDFKDLLFSISAQVVVNKVFEYVKQNKSPELAKCLEEEKELFNLPRNNINSEMYSKASTLFDNSVKDALSMDELRDLVQSRFNSWKYYVASKFKGIPIELLDNEIETMLDKFYSYIQDLASKQCTNDSDKIIEKIDELRKNSDSRDSDSEGCPASKETLKQITKLLSTFAGNTIDLLIMKLSNLSDDKKAAVKSLKFKYMDVIRRCTESTQLAGWILLDPEVATNVIQELTGLEVRKIDNVPDFSTYTDERKREHFINRLREMNRQYIETLPKKGLTGDEWLVILYRLEQLEEKLKEAFIKVAPAPKVVQPQAASEAEILAAKGLSKIIGKANVRIVKKVNQEPPKPKKEVPPEEVPQVNEKDEKKAKNDALLAKCEAILTSKGEKSLLDSFYTIKSYITQGLQVPETYKKHVISICSSIDAKLLDEDIEETLKIKTDEQEPEPENKDKVPLSVIGSQNPELLAKYSAQALRNAKQTLNAVAFRNMTRNGQTKSESDVCDTPKTNCKWTNDCVCDSCKDSDLSSVCLGDIVKQCYDDKSKNGLEEKKKEVKKVPPKPKPAPKPCENANHQQHVCKGEFDD